MMLSCPAVAAAQGASSPAAVADEDAAASGEIIVSARLRAEDIQTVPISITAYTAEDLQARNVNGLLDLANSTPGFAFTTASGGNTATVVLRGIAPAVTNNDLNVDANVGVFIDGIYQTSRNTFDLISILDVGQIEIAKGPQSALYGRSTFAGAIGISTRRPSHQLEASVAATIAEDKDYRIRGTISGPIVDGLLYARVAAGALTYDGYGKNLANPSDNLNGYRKYGATASLEFTPSPEFTALLSAFVTKTRNEPIALNLLPVANFNCGVPNAAFGRPLLYCGEVKANKVSDVSADVPLGDMRTRQIALRMQYDAGIAKLTSVTGLTSASNISYTDYDGTSTGLLFGVCPLGNACLAGGSYTRTYRANLLVSSREKVRSFSQELRIQGDDDAPLQWLFGGYYFNSRVPLNNTAAIATDGTGLGVNDRLVQILPVQTTPNFGPYDVTANLFLVPTSSVATQVAASYAQAKTTTKSVFGSLGYDFGDLRVSAEGRYSWDTKRAQTFSAAASPTLAPGAYPQIDGLNVPAPGVFPIVGTPYKNTFKQFTPRFTVDYQPVPDLLIYANAAKGARAGGFNVNPVNNVNGILASEVAYDSETNWTYETGIKSRLFDRRLLLNLSVFRTDWKNVQISAFTTNPNLPANVVPLAITRNAGGVKSKGFEVQSNFKVSDLLNIGGSISYSDPKFQAGTYDAGQISRCRLGTTPATYTAAPGCPPIIAVQTANGGTQYVPSLEGKRPLRSVKLQWNLNATLGTELNDDWRLTARVDVNYTGPVYGNNINTYYFGERTLTNLRIALDSEKIDIALFANNIFDKSYTQNSISQPRANLPTGNNVPELFLGQDRQIGLTATLHY